MATNQEEIGNDATLFIAGAQEGVPITSASYSQEADVSEVQFNTSLTQNVTVTGVSYSGSFEHSGANTDLYDQLFTEQSTPISAIPQKVSSITIRDSQRKYVFKGVVIGSRSKDLPADDRTSVSYDFTAEELTITER